MVTNLRGPRWELGTCIPENLLWGNDSPLRNQRQIQSITLITDGECGTKVYTQYLVDLVQFKGLQSLEWRGLNRYDDFESVRECIQVHGHQIQSLTIDILFWDRAERIWADGFRKQIYQHVRIPDNFFAQRVLNVQPGDQRIVFPSLKSLHLSAVSFYHTGMEMIYAFNIEHLKSLKLRNCPGSLDWLQLIFDYGKTMKLKSLELALNRSSRQRGAFTLTTETISKFIQHVYGLESLYLMLPEPIDWTTLTDRISSHCNLKRFVMHHLVDTGGHEFIDGDIPWSFRLEHILQGRQLTCFGTSMLPGPLVCINRRC